MDPTRILFVDDEPNILHALKRMWRRQCTDWEMDFVFSGTAALARIQEQNYAVVVTDLRMPQVDGTEVLAEVSRVSPGTARFVLSGQADHRTMERVLNLAHQFIAKPCRPELLVNLINQAMHLRDRMTNWKLRDRITSTASLRISSAVQDAVWRGVSDPKTPLEEIAELATRDICLTAKLLQFANSSFFGFNREVYSIDQAVHLLGKDIIMNLLQSEPQTPEPANWESESGLSLRRFSEESHRRARQAHSLASQRGESPNICDMCYSAALLMDIGKLILAKSVPRLYSEIQLYAQAFSLPLTIAELDLLGVTHAEIGAYRLGLWGLPRTIVDAIASQYDVKFSHVVAEIIALTRSQSETRRTTQSMHLPITIHTC